MSPPMQLKERKRFAESINGKEAVSNQGGRNADLLIGNNSFYNETPIDAIPSVMDTRDQSPIKARRNRAESGPEIVSPAQ